MADQASQGGERVRAAEVIAALSAKVIWCTGFDPDFSWIGPGVDRDAEHIVRAILAGAGPRSGRPGVLRAMGSW